MSSPSKRQILVVDDNPGVRETIAMLLVSAGYDVFVAEDGFSALFQLRRTKPDVIVSDLVTTGEKHPRRFRTVPTTKRV